MSKTEFSLWVSLTKQTQFFWNEIISVFLDIDSCKRIFQIFFNTLKRRAEEPVKHLWWSFLQKQLWPKRSIKKYFENLNLTTEPIIRTGITSKKIPCYMRNSACRWRIVENAKIIWSYAKHFWNLPHVRSTDSGLVYANMFSLIFQLYLLTETMKQSQCQLFLKNFHGKSLHSFKKFKKFKKLKV